MNTTVIIPVAPYHKAVLPRAIASVQAQTTPCKALYMVDGQKRGPGAIRNQLLTQVDTPYVVFLDADDWITPDYISTCEEAMKRGRYVYTDWWQGDKLVIAPARPWCGGTWHVITAMVWTEDAQVVGGFDETLEAIEDTDFWLKLVTRKICGIHIPRPLMHYGKEGQRAKRIFDNGTVETLRTLVKERYAGMAGCCGGDNGVNATTPVGTRQENDVLAQALWGGNRREYGRSTGRWYPRMSAPKTTWVDPRDVEAMPAHWLQVVEPAVTDAAPMGGWEGLRQVFHRPTLLPDEDTIDYPEPGERPDFTPDVAHVVRVARERLG